MMSRLANWWPPVVDKPRTAASAAELNLAKLVALLADSPMTLAALRERGVRAPAQCLYDLQLAGYSFERVPPSPGAGDRSVRYRLAHAPAGTAR